MTTVTPTMADHQTAVRKLKRLARRVLEARNAEAQAKVVVNEARPDMVELFHKLGLSDIEAVPGEGIQLVEPIMRKHDEAAIEAYVKRYKPELHDLLFPAVRKLNTSMLRDALDSGLLPDTVEKYITDEPGTPQLKRIEYKGSRS